MAALPTPPQNGRGSPWENCGTAEAGEDPGKEHFHKASQLLKHGEGKSMGQMQLREEFKKLYRVNSTGLRDFTEENEDYRLGLLVDMDASAPVNHRLVCNRKLIWKKKTSNVCE